MTNLINNFNEVTGLVDKVRAVAVVCLDYSRAFDTLSYEILIENLLIYGPDEQTVRWVENCLTC